jgi:hypothetical protein
MIVFLPPIVCWAIVLLGWFPLFCILSLQPAEGRVWDPHPCRSFPWGHWRSWASSMATKGMEAHDSHYWLPGHQGWRLWPVLHSRIFWLDFLYSR